MAEHGNRERVMGTIDPKRHDFAADPHRPAYHFVPPANLLKDANGTIYWDGRYHLFYQYNPFAVEDDLPNMHWGHAVSDDLFHWRDLPIAIGKTPDGPDRLGCYSGCAIDVDGVPTLFYYGSPDGICIAQSNDGMVTWEKHADNPIIPQQQSDAEWRTFDPCVWRDGDGWAALCGGRTAEADTAYLLRSDDFSQWRYCGKFYVGGDPFPPESDCAVPNFFPLGDKHMLLFASHAKGAQYYLGDYSGDRFTPTHHARLNRGEFTLECGNFIAPNTLLDPRGRRIMFGWIPEGIRYPGPQVEAGWAGIIGLPAVLSMSQAGTVIIEPVEEVEGLRGEHVRNDDVTLSAERLSVLDDVRGDRLEIQVRIDLLGADSVDVTVRRSPNGEEQTRITYDAKARTLTLDVAQSSLRDDFVGRTPQTCDLPLGPSEELDLRIFVDRSVVEVFPNSRDYLAKRIYPTRTDSVGVAVHAAGGDARISSLDAWQMDAVWPIA